MTIRPLYISLLWLAFVAVAAPFAHAGEGPDQIYVNGKIITADDVFSIAEAVAVREGRFTAVGSDATIRALAGDGTAVIDLGGRTVIPGLIDAHTHFIRGTEHWTNEARLDGVTSRARALELIREKAASLAPGEWAFSLGGWIEDQFADESSGFTLAELDAIVPDRPLFTQARYQHAFVNSRWLDEMGIPVAASDQDTASATGLAAFVERDGDGRATGKLTGGFPMIGQAINRFPPVAEPRQIEGIKSAMTHLNSLGLTAVYDGGGLGIQQTSYERIGQLHERGELTLRIYYTLWGGLLRSPDEAAALVAKIRAARPFQGDNWYNQIAMGEVYYAPFHWDDFTRHATPTETDIAAARQILTAAAEAGWPVQTHALHPDSIGRLFDVMEELAADHPVRAMRWSVTHADNVGPAELERARRLGVNFQLRSYAVIGGLQSYRDVLGDALLDMPPLRLVQDSGVPFGFGTDGTKAAQINPFVSLWWAVTGAKLNGDIVTRQTLTREEALIAHTRSNAYLTYQEANLGAIKPGYLADMVVLDRDYLTVPVDEIREIRPVATIVEGRTVYGSL